ncbi:MULTISPECIES: nucleotidyltransferase domain-containing protein [unclassified Paenibacillus]|uniref:type VII toxin-antitoxin system MntA family adenylyltransferase antitoxin n=1 Tax=unclassified Paenibacillus TaxID=185978 RepID=UPI001B763920|nr:MULTISPECIES: nucleotidyltransferase domain-containing protein [unclassified Paenibacillus]MBP1157480.1 putative nucleotidyltransferase [Paenibacillus sp. PvP091]MBP1171783.1 putative nucleotidyltransferase [Paenibacillus sp. PvR098]MBP2438164.1 putative nucleotidyltransferase [Paenibacillus sp. PvP052]
MILQETLYNQMIDSLSPYREIEKVILFGSRARGDAEERSDIDLAIQAPEADLKTWMNILHSVEDLDTLLLIDVIRLEEASSDLRLKIESEGKMIYERNQN